MNECKFLKIANLLFIVDDVISAAGFEDIKKVHLYQTEHRQKQ
jgi:hypothetical protein